MRIPSLWLTLACSIGVLGEARAGDRSPIAPHPLLSEEARALGAGRLSRAEAEALLPELAISEWSVEGVDGSARRGSRVALREVEALPERAVERLPDPGVILHPALRDALDRGELSSAPTELAIGLRTEGTAVRGTWSNELLLGYLTGDIRGAEDEEHVRLAWVAERQAAGKQLIDWFLADADGLEVIERGDFTATLVVRGPATAVEALARHPAVRQVEPFAEGRPEAGHAYYVDGEKIDGYERMDIIQTTPLYNAGYYGAEQVGMWDSGWVRRSHPGFDNNLGADRVQNCDGTGLTCTSNPNPSVGGGHATMVASALVGDITRNQDGNFSCGSPISRACHERSGVARRASVLALAGNATRAVDVGIDRGFKVFNTSLEHGSDPNCTGATSTVRMWHGLYEGGTAFFKAGGNAGHADAADCTVTSPGTGMGVFASSQFWVNASHVEEIEDSATRGGTTGQGAPRSIVAAAPPTYMTYSYQADTSLGDYWDPNVGWQGGSSASSPVAAGMATVYRDWYLNSGFGSLVNDPGILYTNLLLMGDRTGQSGALTTGFDNVWGAGKLRLRTFGPAGLDGPARFETGSECVSHGDSVNVDLTPGGPLSADVDVVRVVVWWYQEKHDDGTEAVNDIDLKLQRQVTAFPASWTTLLTSANNDNKQQVTYFSPSTWEMRFQLVGNNVATDLEGCGFNGVRVYYAALWEDNDRDDDSTLQTYIRPW